MTCAGVIGAGINSGVIGWTAQVVTYSGTGHVGEGSKHVRCGG